MRSNRRTAPASRTHAKRWLVVGTVIAALVGAELSTVAYGSAAKSHHNPVGHVNRIRQGDQGVYIRGWAYDADTRSPAHVRVVVDGKTIATSLAKLRRSDVAAAHPSYGSNRGFHYLGAVPSGRHTVCVYVVNYPTKQRVLLKCKRVDFQFNPFGTISSLTQSPGHLTAKGWAIDPNNERSARVATVRVDGKVAGRGTANLPVTGLSGTYPKAGSNHGYAVTFPVAEGTHQICVAATNIGLGRNRTVKCVTKSVNFSPTGAITKLVQVPGGFRVHGYASDPDTTAKTSVTITADGTSLGTVNANRPSGKKPGYQFYADLRLPGTGLKPGTRTICAVAKNLGSYGKNRAVQCVGHDFNWNPTAGVTTLVQKSPGATITGWAADPDTSDPVKVNIIADGKRAATHVIANGAGGTHSGHMFTTNVPLPDGTHTVCARALNLSYGSGPSAPACATVKLAFEPFGALESLGRSGNNIVAKGWTIDPDTTAAVPVTATVTGGATKTGTANVLRSDIAKKYPGTGTSHGYSVVVASDDKEHKVCVTATNLLGGSGTTNLGCRIINAVHPLAPAAPTSVTASAGYGGARISWSAPTSDGGAPWTGYTIKASPGGVTAQVGATATAATVLGLKPSTKYSFSVVANNVAGASKPGTSPAVTTEKEPPAQTSPAPVSTSRYIRNISGASAADLATMRREGAADAKANPSGHGYLVLLDIGGQDQSRHGVVLSATIRFVSNANLVADLKAYVDGYAGQLKPSAPATIAIGTNNDVDVTASAGAAWADSVVDPVASYAKRYPGITIAGANDIEPGFRATYAQTHSWLTGYLGATHAPFVFNGSADGCSWTGPARGCNNGWTMSGLFTLAGGAAPIRILNLPQIYNTTMAQQWRYISLTGVRAGSPRINFGGALTEYTACRQAGSCGSLTGTSAWKSMWSQLNAEPLLRPKTLPYATDLRIDS